MCDVPKCGSRDVHLIFYGKDVCEKCWVRHCEGKVDLKKKFGILGVNEKCEV